MINLWLLLYEGGSKGLKVLGAYTTLRETVEEYTRTTQYENLEITENNYKETLDGSFYCIAQMEEIRCEVVSNPTKGE